MNQIIKVPDIAIVKTVDGTKKLLSLRDQKIKKDTLHTFGAGSGVKYNGDLYVLQLKEYMVRMITSASNITFKYVMHPNGFEVDWGDGTREINSYSHTYTDGIISHEIALYSLSGPFLSLPVRGISLTSINVSTCPELKVLHCEDNKLNMLDLNKNIRLTEIICDSNPISAIDVSYCQDLRYLSIANTEISSLDVSANKKLTSLVCMYSPISTDKDNLINLANSLPYREIQDSAEFAVGNTTSAAWIQDICTAKNWTIL